jgi:hypothetical protein
VTTRTLPPINAEDELPPGWVAVQYLSVSYLCDEGLLGKAECVLDRGQRPSVIITPDVYCSDVGLPMLTECDERWYPDELESELEVIDGADYVCKDALGSFGDVDCYQYTGGDPSQATGGFSPDLYCSGRMTLQCNEYFYPSEFEGLEVVSIDGTTHVCEETFEGSECFEWSGFGSPRDAVDMAWEPDYYCNYLGDCARDYYP